jgi:Protein of unknown function (DUF3551)
VIAGITMRELGSALVALPVMLLVSTVSADAQNYPWCSARGESRNCGFVSWEQCMANGGFCERNFMYRPEPDRTAPGRKRRR